MIIFNYEKLKKGIKILESSAVLELINQTCKRLLW